PLTAAAIGDTEDRDTSSTALAQSRKAEHVSTPTFPSGCLCDPVDRGPGDGRHAGPAAPGAGGGHPQGAAARRVGPRPLAGHLLLSAGHRDGGAGRSLAVERVAARLPRAAAADLRQGFGGRAAVGPAVRRRPDDDLRGARADDARRLAET